MIWEAMLAGVARRSRTLKLMVALLGGIVGHFPTALAAVSFHYAPAENLEKIDVAQLSAARQTINMAAYLLTDWPVIEALTAAAHRGVRIRIYIDGEQAGRADMQSDHPFARLLATPGVTVRNKQASASLMHLKSYCVDGRLLRSGSANFSASGLKDQDNDLILSDELAACAGFTAAFERGWSGPDSE